MTALSSAVESDGFVVGAAVRLPDGSTGVIEAVRDDVVATGFLASLRSGVRRAAELTIVVDPAFARPPDGRVHYNRADVHLC